jgi:hypothetical protein
MVAVLGRPGQMTKPKLLRAKLELLAEAAVRWYDLRAAAEAETSDEKRFEALEEHRAMALEELLEAIADYKRIMHTRP